MPGTSNQAISEQKSGSVTTGPQANTQGSAMGLHGALYQLKLFMLFLFRAASLKYSFQLGTEVKEAKKFDDVVFRNDTLKTIRFVQAKHIADESKKITAGELLTENENKFSLIKYFFSYVDLRKEKVFKKLLITDVTICTNVDFNYDDLGKEKIDVRILKDEDDILDVLGNLNTKQPKRYKFNEDIIHLLKPKLQKYNLTRLARRLVECLLNSTSIKHHDANDIFQSYQFALADEVVDVKRGRFHDKFINGDVSVTAKEFRELFIAELNRKSNSELNIDNINKEIDSKKEIIYKTPIRLRLSKKFGIGKDDKSWPTNVISDDQIKDFLEHLVFAVNQPNQKELDQILRNEIGEYFNLDFITTENVYNKFFVENLEWLLTGNRDNFLSYEEAKKMFDNIKEGITILFDVRAPIDLFTGREKELKNLHEALQDKKTTAILQTVSVGGLGGIGKSELARKYIHVYSEFYNNRVVWINAESCQSILQSFRRLAQDKLKISVQNSDKTMKDTKSILEDVYKSFSKGKSLFIFDNAEKYRTEDENDEGIDKFLPYVPPPLENPYILITSRNREWGDNVKVISLDVLTEKEAMDFIRKALDIKDDLQVNEIRKLVITLEFFPLALQQAVAFIRETDSALKNIGKKFDINDYIQRYSKETEKLLDFKFPSYSNDKYTKTTYTTWKITIDRIKENQEYGDIAILIFYITAYLNAEDIRTNMFSCLVNDDEVKLAFAIKLLIKYSLIDTIPGKGVLNIHRLVQQVIQINLKRQKNEEEEIMKKTCELLYKNTTTASEHTAWRLLPHLEIFLSYVLEVYYGFELGEEFSNPKNCFIAFSFRSDEYERKVIELLSRIESIERKSHYLIIVTLNSISNVHYLIREFRKCREILNLLLPLKKKHFASNDLGVADTLINIGHCCKELKEYEKGIDFFQRALKIIEDNYGRDHFDVAQILKSFGWAYYYLNDFEKQKQVLERALPILKLHYGDNSDKLYCILANLGNCYVKLNDIQKGKEFLQGVMKIAKERDDGRPYPEMTLVTHCDLCGHINNFNESQELFDWALPILEERYSDNHSKLASLLRGFGFWYTEVDPQKAKELLQQALNIEEVHFGPYNIRVVNTLRGLALAYGACSDYEEGKVLLERALDIFETHHGDYCPSTIGVTLHLFGYCFNMLNDTQRGFELQERSIEISRQVRARARARILH